MQWLGDACICSEFGQYSSKLGTALSAFAWEIIATHVDQSDLMAYTALIVVLSPSQMPGCTDNWDGRSLLHDHWESHHEIRQTGSSKCCWISPSIYVQNKMQAVKLWFMPCHTFTHAEDNTELSNEFCWCCKGWQIAWCDTQAIYIHAQP